MPLSVRVLAPARIELAEAAAWYARERAELGGELIIAYESVLQHALEFPQIGSIATSVGKKHEVRRFVFERFPYDLVTMKLAQELIVIAIAHHHRKPGYWKHRLAKVHP